MTFLSEPMEYSHHYSGEQFEVFDLNSDSRQDQSWTSVGQCFDPFGDECHLQYKSSQPFSRDPFTFQSATTISLSAPRETFYNYETSAIIPSWHLPQPDYRSLRIDSPNDNFGSAFSAPSSESSVDQSTGSIASLGSPIQSFIFAPIPADYQLNQNSAQWIARSSTLGSLPSPPDSTIMATQAIALKELEFQSVTECPIEPCSYNEALFSTSHILPMHVPEELDISEDIATLTASSRAETRSPAEVDSSQDERDRDSDLDFDPQRSRNGVRINGSARRGRLHQPRLSQSSASMQVSPLLDRTSRIHKPTRRLSSQNNTEKTRYKIGPRSNSSKSNSTSSSKIAKSFPCAFHKFGCGAVFANKNEWKRHVSSQHLQLGVYRCDLGGCNPDNSDMEVDRETRPRRKSHRMQREEEEKVYNDFNRKDLFTQHCRRMHGPLRYTTDGTTATNQKILKKLERSSHSPGMKSRPAKSVVTKEDELEFEAELDIIRKRCWQVRRKAPTRTYCGFCNKVFEVGIISTHHQMAEHDTFNNEQEDSDYGKAEEKLWEERMEHVARHYERDHESPEREDLDEDLQDWGLEVGILERVVDTEGNERALLVGYDGLENVVSTGIDTESVSGIQLSTRPSRRSGLRNRRTQTESVDTIVVDYDEEDDDIEDALAEDE